MSKIHSQADKETIIGISLLIGLALWFVVNIVIVFSSLVVLYGAQEEPSRKTSPIDDSALSRAIQLLRNQE